MRDASSALASFLAYGGEIGGDSGTEKSSRHMSERVQGEYRGRRFKMTQNVVVCA